MKTLTKPKRKKLTEVKLKDLGTLVAVDTETTGLNSWKGARPFAFSFCNPEGKTAYMEFPVDPFTREVNHAMNAPAWAELKEFMADASVTKVFHNAKFDVRMIRCSGLPFAGRIHETMFAAHCCKSNEPSFKLKDLGLKYFGIKRDDQEALQAGVVKLRRLAKKAGWKIAKKVEPDYWLPMQARRCGLVVPRDCEELVGLCERYAVRDAERTMLLWLLFRDKMKELNVRKVYDREMKLWPVTYAMEERGVRIEPKEIDKLEKTYRRDRDERYQEIAGWAAKAVRAGKVKLGKTAKFNPASPVQLQALVYDYLKLKKEPNPYAKKQNPRSCDVDSMMELSVQHPLPEAILKHRAASRAMQFLESYRDLMLRAPELKCHLMHADFQQVGPKTGRFSCRTPNMQQIPTRNASRSPFPIDARAPFGPRPGHVWYNIDYSQLEVRIFADLSQEQTLLKIIRSGQHVHRAGADHVWGGQTDKAVRAAIKAMGFNAAGTSDDTPALAALRKKWWQRSEEHTAAAWLKSFNWSIVAAEASIDRKNSVNKAKLMIFTRLFGGGIPSIMNLLKCTRAEAKELLQEYADGYPDMVPWIEKVTREARREGHAITAYGRRIAVDPEFAYRAVNYRVQGSAADLMKRALIGCETYLRDNNVRAWIVMTIHDEIVFEFHKEEERMPHVLALKRIMEDHGGAFTLEMPTEVERVRRQWDQKEKVKWAA